MTGFINIDKAAGASSAKEVAVVKKLSGTACGHMGTLDPMATGVLPVAVGNAARLFDYFLSKTKTYVADFRFGTDSDTLDTTGNILRDDGRIPAEEEILTVLPRFEGELMQIPPRFSAKNVDGKRGYALARAGVEFDLPPKKVTVHNMRLIGRTDERTYRFEIECGGGTYIRSLARDLGAALGTCAVMSALRRTKSGIFAENTAVTTSSLTKENFENYLIPTDSVLPFNAIYVGGNQQKKLLNGCAVESGDQTDGIYKLYLDDGSFYGLVEVKQSTLKVRIKLC